MTSSLVGSEMCIRDRGTTRNPERVNTPGRSSQGKVGRTNGYPQDHRSVSYTHLTLPTICSV
eukprot:10153480-Prorocentrum_lima.AAC.1